MISRLIFETETDIILWQQQAIASGQAWIQAATATLFQPQELRLHQREGIHYDKGCYLGQEVIARLWFKAAKTLVAFDSRYR